jgi:hypothetical protein
MHGLVEGGITDMVFFLKCSGRHFGGCWRNCRRSKTDFRKHEFPTECWDISSAQLGREEGVATKGERAWSK